MDNLSINLALINLTNNYTPKVDAGIYYRNVCGQLSSYFIKVGIIIIALYIFISWFNWWFFNYGYLKISYKHYDQSTKLGKFIGSLNDLDTRIYWEYFIKMRLLKLAIGYIAVVVYFNWI
jgi:hypothetical protein